MTNIIILGPPGAGKGTQGGLLSERIGVPRISTGDLLRAAVRDGTELGLEAKSYMDRGLLVPDRVVLGLIREILGSSGAERGMIMDGFPRTVAQAEAVDGMLKDAGRRVDHVLEFNVRRDELIARILGRAATEGRSDDTPEAIAQRLDVYARETMPLIDRYRIQGKLRVIDGEGTLEEISRRVDEAIGPE